MTQIRMLAAATLLVGVVAAAQPPAGRIVGTVKSVRADTREVTVAPDRGELTVARVEDTTVLQRVAPGQTDLKNAAPIQFADIAAGDRVLVTLDADTGQLRRLVVMPVSDIAKRNEADRRDWNARGISGVVASVSGDRITLKKRSFTGEIQETVTVKTGAVFRRYSPDSVRFADAAPSSLAEVRNGDQLRARGEKSADGLAVTADEVVFGTFTTHGGSIETVDTESRVITIKQLATGKPLRIRLTADSQLKRMPDFSAAGPRPPSGGAPARGPAGPMAARGGPPDLAQMIEFMPAAKLETLKPGETILVSSTKGARESEITAIMVLANADMLLQMAAMMGGASPGLGSGGMPAAAGMGMAGALGGPGLELPGMTF